MAEAVAVLSQIKIPVLGTQLYSCPCQFHPYSLSPSIQYHLYADTRPVSCLATFWGSEVYVHLSLTFLTNIPKSPQ